MDLEGLVSLTGMAEVLCGSILVDPGGECGKRRRITGTGVESGESGLVRGLVLDELIAILIPLLIPHGTEPLVLEGAIRIVGVGTLAGGAEPVVGCAGGDGKCGRGGGTGCSGGAGVWVWRVGRVGLEGREDDRGGVAEEALALWIGSVGASEEVAYHCGFDIDVSMAHQVLWCRCQCRMVVVGQDVKPIPLPRVCSTFG